MVPSFLLAKLYVKGSLKNNETGFEFALKNLIDSTMLTSLGPIVAGDKTYAGSAITMTAGDRTTSGAELLPSNPIPVRMGMLMKISVSGDKLAAGTMKISLTATSAEAGKLKFDISDTVG